MAILGPKPWFNPFGKMSILRLLELLVFIAQKDDIFFQNIVKDIFLALLRKKKVGKMAILGPKPWANPFGKMSIFRLFERLVFIAQKGVFSFQNILKDIFLAYIAEKEKLKIWPFLYQNHELTPLEKSQLFSFLNLLFSQARKTFFRCRISQDIFLAYIDKKTNLKKWLFLDQNHGLTPLKKCQFFDFLNSFFLNPKKAFFRSRIS